MHKDVSWEPIEARGLKRSLSQEGLDSLKSFEVLTVSQGLDAL